MSEIAVVEGGAGEIEIGERLQRRERNQSRTFHQSVGETQSAQVGHSGEVAEGGTGYRRIVEAQLSEICEAREVYQAGIADFGGIQIEPLERGRGGEAG